MAKNKRPTAKKATKTKFPTDPRNVLTIRRFVHPNKLDDMSVVRVRVDNPYGSNGYVNSPRIEFELGDGLNYFSHYGYDRETLAGLAGIRDLLDRLIDEGDAALDLYDEMVKAKKKA